MMSTNSSNCAIQAWKTIFSIVPLGSLNGELVKSSKKGKGNMIHAAENESVQEQQITTIG